MPPTLSEMPWLYAALSAGYVVLGRFGAAFFYRMRFGRSPHLNAHPDHKKSRHFRYTQVAGIAFMAQTACLFLHFGGAYEWRWGCVAAAAALLGMLTCQWLMGRAFRMGQDEIAQDELMMHGPWRWSRNPIYVCSIVYVAAQATWAASAIVIGLAVVFAACVHGLVLEEEQFLAKRFGDRYTQYRRNTPRYALGPI